MGANLSCTNIPQQQIFFLAKQYGVQTSYRDAFGRQKTVAPESLLSVLQARGAPLHTWQDVVPALKMRTEDIWRSFTDPIAVAWDHRPAKIILRLPAERTNSFLHCRLQSERGEIQEWRIAVQDLPVIAKAALGKKTLVAQQMQLPAKLHFGYHRLVIQMGKSEFSTLIIAAPLRAYCHGNKSRLWGAFVPLHALHTGNSWGSGDFSDLGRLGRWINSLGGQLIATLPFLAGYLERPREYSPYLPASKLFWNEFYLDLTRIPEWEDCPQARLLYKSAQVQRTLKSLKNSPLVNYGRGMALKRKILEELSEAHWPTDLEAKAVFRRFVSSNPEVESYARFRATLQKQARPWPKWQTRLREGDIRAGDYCQAEKNYQIYVQWQAHRQLEEVTESGRMLGTGLYLDLPLGVHPDGYDTWRFKDQFIREISVGAPPDQFFVRGQNWRFPPIHPEKMRSDGYTYFRACLQNVMRFASFLRIDHIMGLHRQFWIPPGAGPQEGVYVCYPAEELYAILCLESHRHKTVIVGEDLGTVPNQVRSYMRRHALLRLYVGQFEDYRESRKRKYVLPQNVVASLNTHDLPTFAAFWKGLDIQDRKRLGLLQAKAAEEESRQRLILKKRMVRFLKTGSWLKGKSDTYKVLKATLKYLHASPAKLVLINMEDLWLERWPQNVPGNQRGELSWRRKTRYDFETFQKMPEVIEILKEVDSLRKKDGKNKVLQSRK